MKNRSHGRVLGPIPWSPPELPRSLHMRLVRAEYLRRWTQVTNEMKARKP